MLVMNGKKEKKKDKNKNNVNKLVEIPGRIYF